MSQAPERNFQNGDYRLYLRGKGDNILSVSEIVCTSDEDGIAKARGIVGADIVELWQGTRLIARIKSGIELPVDSEHGSVR